MIHPLADCKSSAIPESTNIWQFCVIFPGCRIGENCNICANSLLESDVIIGDNVTIKSGVQLWNGVRVEDDVFIGPNASFCNDKVPRSKHYKKDELTVLQKGCSIGANATVLTGITIGAYSMIGAGAVITHSTEPYSLWVGNPARQTGFVTRSGVVLDMEKKNKLGIICSLDD